MPTVGVPPMLWSDTLSNQYTYMCTHVFMYADMHDMYVHIYVYTYAHVCVCVYIYVLLIVFLDEDTFLLSY